MTEFVIERLPGEVLVYDQVQHRAHCLTPLAARVWQLCEAGSVEDARAALRDSKESLESVLSQLESAGLVRARVERVNRSRRHMLGKTAVAAGVVLASPIIYSIISPSVAEAASCGKANKPCCTTNPKCTLPAVCIGNVCRG